MRFHRSGRIAVPCSCALALCLAAACGDDDDSGGAKATGGTGGKDGGAATGGKGGSIGKGGSGGSLGGGGGTTGGGGAPAGGASGGGAGGGTSGSGGAAGNGGVGGAIGGSAGVAGSDAGDGSGGSAGDPVRGEYLVRHVAVCADCHTPRKPDGTLDQSKWLAGVANFIDLDPSDPNKGMIHAPNLTSDTATGLGGWLDAEVKKAFLDGVNPIGTPLVPVMPYFVYHNMTSQDADAIVAYLRAVPTVANAIPAKQPLPFPLTQPASPVPANALPDTTLPSTDTNYQAAVRGKYLAANIGICMECHTKRVAASAVPLDLTKLFAGGEVFPAAAIGLPSPPFPANIVSANITPHQNGIQGWTAAQVSTLLLTGIGKDQTPVCPPMPAGPGQAFSGLTAQDALDIGHYITTLTPIDHGPFAACTPSFPEGGSDAGTSDASDDGAQSDAGDAAADVSME